MNDTKPLRANLTRGLFIRAAPRGPPAPMNPAERRNHAGICRTTDGGRLRQGGETHKPGACRRLKKGAGGNGETAPGRTDAPRETVRQKADEPLRHEERHQAGGSAKGLPGSTMWTTLSTRPAPASTCFSSKQTRRTLSRRPSPGIRKRSWGAGRRSRPSSGSYGGS